MAGVICRVAGIVLLSLGIWGFMAHDSFLVFEVNPVHHIVQVVIGAAALWAGWSDERFARRFCMAIAGVSAGAAILGFLNVSAVVDLLHMNRADHWLHLLIGGAFLAAVLRSRTPLTTDRDGREMRPHTARQGSPGM